MNKIFYIANIRIPTEKAHGIQIMKMCEGFQKNNQEIVLLLPKRFNPLKQDPFDYYAIKDKFIIKKIPVIDTISLGKLGFIFESLQFSLFSTLYVLFKKNNFIFTRDTLTAFLLTLLRKKVILENHTGGYKFFMKYVCKKAHVLIVISNGLKDFYINKGVDGSKIKVHPDGVDLDLFTVDESKEEIKKGLGIPLDKKIIIYTGHLYKWKGADILAQAAKNMNALTLFVGGIDKEIKIFKEKYESENVKFLGRVEYQNIPKYTYVADVLVIPNSDQTQISREFTSPMKLFEYMASKNVIVASDIPSIREIVSGEDVIFFESDNVISLESALKRALSEDISLKIKNSYNKALLYTWDTRAKKIINYYAD